MFLGDWRVWEQLRCGIRDMPVKSLLAAIDACQHRGDQEQFEGAARWEALVRAMRDGLSARSIDGEDAKTSTATTLEIRKLGDCAIARERRYRPK